MADEKNPIDQAKQSYDYMSGERNTQNSYDFEKKMEGDEHAREMNLRYNSQDLFTIPDDTFTTPEMGDFYLGAIDCKYLNKLDEMLTGHNQQNGELDPNVERQKAAAFYTEKPRNTELGYSGRSVFLKASLGDSFMENGWTNGCSLRIPLSDIDVGSMSGRAELFKELDSVQNPYANIEENDSLLFSLYGLTAPTPDLFATETVPATSVVRQTVSLSDIRGNSNYVFSTPEATNAKDNEVTFVQVGSKWHQAEILSEVNGTLNFKWMIGARSGELQQAFMAQQRLKDFIDKGDGSVYIQIDRDCIGGKTENAFSQITSDASARDQLQDWANNSLSGACNGFCLAKMSQVRCSGIAYIKVDGKWINLAKAVLADNIEGVQENPGFNGEKEAGFGQNYNQDAQVFADAFFAVADELDDRKAIQKKLLGKEWDFLSEWTVTIGDVTLMVPPTNIQVLSETEEQRAQLLRANGSVAKAGKREIRTINMTIYFEGEEGINGKDYLQFAPNGYENDYSMNGLRALIAEFKFTPFLPIENRYLNETLGIHAIAFNNMQISNVPSVGPRLMVATITMTEFDYSVYVPEVAVMGAQTGRAGSWFSTAFNWPVMRYYYQRCLAAGNKMANLLSEHQDDNGKTKTSQKGVNSAEYIRESLKNRTALQPMRFKSSRLKFYIADEEYLEKMRKEKLDRKKNMAMSISYDADQRQFMSVLGENMLELDQDLKSDSFKKALEEVNKNAKFSYKAGGIFTEHTIMGDAFNGSSIIAQPQKGDEPIDLDKRLNAAMGPLLTKLKEKKCVSWAKFVSTAHVDDAENGNTAQVGIELDLNMDVLFPGITDEDEREASFDKLRSNAAVMLGVPEGTIAIDNRLFIPLTLQLEAAPTTVDANTYNGVEGLKLDEDSPDLKFLRYCIEESGINKSSSSSDPTSKGNGNGITSWKKATNLAELDNLKYVDYDCGDFVVTSFSASLSNHQARISMSETGQNAPQYLGGEDVSFHVSIITQDKKTASAFTAAPHKIASIMRKYRAIIPCCPFKVDSEFTRFLGVNECSIQSVSVNTVPNQPGVYSIEFDMISTDRTMRNREAMDMIEANNAGRRGSSERALKDLKSYFDFESVISQAELYPDLELPSLAEMESLGWEYVRYKFQDNRVYVDPDFYFVYLSQLSSQILRDSIVQSVANGVDGSATYEDINGAMMSVSPEKFRGFSTSNHNSELDNQLSAIDRAKNAKSALNAKPIEENLRESRDAYDSEDYEGWDICNDIKSMFLEQRYRKEYEAYLARLRAAAVSNAGQDAAANIPDNELINDSENLESIANKAGSDSNTPPPQQDEASKKLATEGKWVAAQLADAMAAAAKIKDYLTNKGIEVAVPEYNAVREQFIAARNSGGDTKNIYSSLKMEIMNATGHFLDEPEVKEILSLLNFDYSTDFVQVTKDIVFSAACAATAEKEFSNKKKSTNWMPAPDFIGCTSGSGIQDATNSTVLYSVDEAISNATEFGIFKITQFQRAKLMDIINEKITDPWKGEEKTVNSSHFLLDPHYREASQEEIAQYKKGCINSTEYCTYAFMRNTLFWLGKLVEMHAYPSINADVLRKATRSELEIEKKESDLNVDDKAKNRELQNHIKFFAKNTYSIDAGKMWVAVCLAASDGNRILKGRINHRDYRALNEYTHGCSVPRTAISISDKVSTMMRKMNLALIGVNRIKDSDAMGVPQDMPAVKHARDITEKKYIEAAEDPKQYMMHACHDMIVHDARGRMLRAFPTFYLVFIDEGREAGMWHLHDNFYNTSAIIDFTVVKDRKNPADTATITLSNIYEACSTEEEDRLRVKESSWGEAFESIFFPNDYGENMENKRQGATLQDQIRIRPGARIHLRAGFGSNASMLPTLFNGSVAEVTAEDVISIVAQGDGIELMNPIMEKEEGQDITNDWSFFKNGDTPKNLLQGLMNYDGGFISRRLKSIGRTDLLGDNPFGIYHFGSKDFKLLSPSGESTQNIFEAWSSPAWGDGTGAMEMPHAPTISFDVFGKTVWDVANICKSTMPDFMCSVVPFDLRSTLFMGAPRYYYAYGYTNINGAIQEKRKPFQQYHVYTSATDLLSNGMCATSQKMKTTATGLYQVCATFNNKEQHTVGPIYADIDIYPECQKSMIVDTQLLAKGVPFLGAAGLNMITSFDAVDGVITAVENVAGNIANFVAGGDTGKSLSETKSNKSVAWRMTASALKDSVKEMYAGDIVVIGDPSIKPFDRVFLMDNYNGISGQVEAKEVVHHMSISNGFITTVSPDCINVVEDRFEHVVHNWFNHTGGIGAAHLLSGAVIATNAALMAAGQSENLITLGKVLNACVPRKKYAKFAQTDIGKDIISKGSELTNGAKEAIKEGAESLSNSGKWGAKAVNGGSKMGKTFFNILKTAAGVGSVGGPVGIATAVAATLATTLAIETIGTVLSNLIDNFMRDLQALTVFPVTRYGMVWTAGMQGSKGCIYGSPSYNEQGAMTQLLADIISPDNPIGGLFASCLFNDDTQGIANSLKAKNDKEESAEKDKRGSTLSRTASEIHYNVVSSMDKFIDKLTTVSTHKEGHDSDIKGDYRALQLSPRANFSIGDDVLNSYNYFKIMDVKNFQNDPKLKNTVLISEDKRLKPYIEEDFFQIIHQYPNLDLGTCVESRAIRVNGVQKYVKVIKCTSNDGKDVCDVPMLNPEALNILYEIVRRTKNKMPAANSSDPTEAYDPNSFIALESALRVGDSTLFSTGYGFILRGVQNAVNPLRSAITEFAAEIKQDAAEGKGFNDSLFDIDEQENNKIAILVRLPRVKDIAEGAEIVSDADASDA